MLTAPSPLAATHEIEPFDCDTPSLNDWLKRRALQNQASGATRTAVCCEANQVVAYYALASSAVAVSAARGRFRRNMLDRIPVVVLGRLAIATSHQRCGLGRALFQDAGRRMIHAAEAIGIRGLLIHALSDDAKAFYLQLGLDTSPLDPTTLMVTIAELRAALPNGYITPERR